MSRRVALDSWAVLNLIDDGPNAAQGEKALDSGNALMSWINLGEVAYIVNRRQGRAAADIVVADVRASVDVHLPDAPLVLAAAAIKAALPMTYPDAVAAATAVRFGVPRSLVTPNCWRNRRRTPESVPGSGLTCANTPCVFCCALVVLARPSGGDLSAREEALCFVEEKAGRHRTGSRKNPHPQ